MDFSTVILVIGGVIGLAVVIFGAVRAVINNGLTFKDVLIGAITLGITAAIVLAAASLTRSGAAPQSNHGGGVSGTVTTTLGPAQTATVAPSPTTKPKPTSTTAIVYATLADLNITDGIYTSGYQTAVIGQEFDAYYLIQNTGPGLFVFKHLEFALDTPSGQTVYMGGTVYDSNYNANNNPLLPQETRKVYMQVSTFPGSCESCSTGIYRLYAIAILPNGSVQDIKRNAVNKSYQVFVNACSSMGQSGTPNRCS